MSKDTVTLPMSRYKQLLDAEEWLNYLYAAGIDNTDAFSIAAEQKAQDEEDEDVSR